MHEKQEPRSAFNPMEASVAAGNSESSAARIATVLLELGAALEEKERRIGEMLRRAIDASDLPLVRELLALWRGEDPPKSAQK
ncbi:MAG: hypothetical protein ACREJD_03105 [Phycisphaerales bacterium]